MQKVTKWLDDNRDMALLFVRIICGLMFVFVHGGPKIMGGEAAWTKIGSMIGVLGITFAPTLLGFIAAVFEFVGGILIAFGLFTRVGAAIILATLVTAAPTMYIITKGLFGAAPALEDGLLMILLVFWGGGKYSLDQYFFSKRK